MSEGLNRVMLLGNLGRDPELRGSTTAALSFSVATTESYFDRRTNERKERTDWHNVVVFGKRGEALSKILTKGMKVFIEGRLQTSSYEKDGQKHYRTRVIATEVRLLAGPGGSRAPDAGSAVGPAPVRPREVEQTGFRGFGSDMHDDHGGDDDDDDIPF